MSLNDILGSALSGLNAAQAGLRTASNNIANVSTPGYAREKVSLQTGVTSGRVSGVLVSEPSRIADRFLEANVFRRQGDQGRAEAVASYLDRLQTLLGAPGESSGLPARLNSIGAAAVTMTGSASTEQTVRAFTGNVEDALQSLQQLSRDVGVLRTNVESEVGYTIDKVNSLLKRIDDLNETVSRQSALGRSAGGASSLRSAAVEELSGLLKITAREQPDGRIAIDTSGGVALLDRRLRQLSYPSGEGVLQDVYPSIDIRFADENGIPEMATGEKIESGAVGGKLGGLLDLRDRAMPAFSDQLGTLFGGLAETLNAVSNAGSTVPAPTRLDGGQTGLGAADRLGFTGRIVVGVTQQNGTLLNRATIDFDALGAGATIADAVAAINAGLGGAGIASFAGGRLSIATATPGTGIVVAQDEAAPSARAGIGFAHYFGLNDLVTSGRGTVNPPGFIPADPHGFATGETAEVILRDPAGRLIARQTLSPATGGTFADLLSDLNGGPVGAFGTFALDDRGRLSFAPSASIPEASLAIPSDSTNRWGTGRSLTSLLQLTGAGVGLSGAQVRPDILSTANRLPLARLKLSAAIGEKALGAGDNRGATAFVEQLAKPVGLIGRAEIKIEDYANLLLGRAGMDAASAKDRLEDAAARRDDAVNRRDSFSGVNVDEELSQLVVLQNSYSAAARVISTATQMYDVLIAMAR